MPRLICVDHKFRVLVLENKTIHRSDRKTCDSVLAIGGKQMTANHIRRRKFTNKDLEETERKGKFSGTTMSNIRPIAVSFDTTNLPITQGLWS